MKKNAKVCRQLHLPVQSGSNRILKQMNRSYSIEWYRECISKLKESMPDLSISTDIIVGFSDESDKDFEETMQLVEDVKFDTIYSFKYSVRPGTPGEKMTNHVADNIALDRLHHLQMRQREISLENNTKQLNKSYEVLIENKSKNNPNELFGRTSQNKAVYVKNVGEEYIGEIVKVTKIEAFQNSFIGELT
jgi:tRNA-2-methylthio-N6-dimethylallyladenosine synthase